MRLHLRLHLVTQAEFSSPIITRIDYRTALIAERERDRASVVTPIVLGEFAKYCMRRLYHNGACRPRVI